MDCVWHPADEAARKMLENSLTANRVVGGGLNKLVEWIEEGTFLENLADNKRIRSDTDARIARIFSEVCKRLGTKPVHLFLDTSPVPNAYAIGGKNASIVLTAGLVELMDDDELSFVLAHELGHVLCNHTRYGILALQIEIVRSFIQMIPAIGPTAAVLVTMNLFYWNRRSELSADRFGLLGATSAEASLSAIAKLAGASKHDAKFGGIASLRTQAEEFRQITQERGATKTTLDLLFGYRAQGVKMSHPWPAVRVWELERWVSSKQYKFLQAGKYAEAKDARFQVDMFFGVEFDGETVKSPAEVYLRDFLGEFYAVAGKTASAAKNGLNAGKDWIKNWVSPDSRDE